MLVSLWLLSGFFHVMFQCISDVLYCCRREHLQEECQVKLYCHFNLLCDTSAPEGCQSNDRKLLKEWNNMSDAPEKAAVYGGLKPN